jgi:hypothetical protein
LSGDDIGHVAHRDLTVAQVRPGAEPDHVEVLFLESAQIYRLPRSHERFDELAARLDAAGGAGRTVRVVFLSPGSNVIDDVTA